MKNYLTILFTVLLFTTACKKKNQPITETTDFNQNKAVKVGVSTFTITEVTDNRCPINADCVTAGKANVALTVRYNSEIKNFNLCLGGDCGVAGNTDNADFIIANIKYKVVLKEVNPFPDFSKVLQPKIVKLEITRG